MVLIMQKGIDHGVPGHQNRRGIESFVDQIDLGFGGLGKSRAPMVLIMRRLTSSGQGA